MLRTFANFYIFAIYMAQGFVLELFNDFDMKKLSGLLAAALFSLSPAMAETYELNAGPFDNLNVHGDFNVVYRSVPDSAGYVVYESPVDINDMLDIRINKGKLSIKKTNVDDTFAKIPTIYVYSDFLQNVTSEGGGQTVIGHSAVVPSFTAKLIGNGKIVINDVNTTNFKASIDTGNGTIAAHGKCTKASFRLTGSGVIQADNLEANEVNCTVLGTGTIGCYPLDVLDVRGLGTTKVYYYGAPTVKKVGAATLVQLKGTPADAASEQAD